MINETEISEVWTYFQSYLDKKQIDIVAEGFVALLADNGVSERTLRNSLGVDQWLDHAIDYFLNDGDETDEEELDF